MYAVADKQLPRNFVNDPPSHEGVVLLYTAASFYEMDIYQTFCENYFRKTYPDSPQSLPPSSPVNLAVQGILLGRKYATLSAILRPAFYDLARAPLWDKPKPICSESDTDVDEDIIMPDSDTSTPETDHDETEQGVALHPLTKLSQNDLIELIELQKRLSVTWDSILNIMNYVCNTDKCKARHTPKVGYIKSDNPYDPILGIERLLDHTPFKTSYCDVAARKVKRLLNAERDGIWDDIRDWLGVSNNGNM